MGRKFHESSLERKNPRKWAPKRKGCIDVHGKAQLKISWKKALRKKLQARRNVEKWVTKKSFWAKVLLNKILKKALWKQSPGKELSKKSEEMNPEERDFKINFENYNLNSKIKVRILKWSFKFQNHNSNLKIEIQTLKSKFESQNPNLNF